VKVVVTDVDAIASLLLQGPGRVESRPRVSCGLQEKSLWKLLIRTAIWLSWTQLSSSANRALAVEPSNC